MKSIEKSRCCSNPVKACGGIGGNSSGRFEKEVLQASEKYAKSKGFVLNSDKKILNAVIAGLARNKKEKGSAYCPCRALTGSKEEDAKNICPCAFHLDEIKADGYCRCWLFFKK